MVDLEQLEDRCKARGKRYSLPFLLTVILMAKLAGEDTPKGIAEWVQWRERQLVAAFQRQRDTVPSYNTIRRTLAELDLRGRIVCGDAMFTQRDISVAVVAQGGDYIWFVKDNHSQLRQVVAQFFVPSRCTPGRRSPQLPQTVAHSTNKGHGRLEQRTLTLMPDETAFLDWPASQQVFKLQRKVTCCRTGEVSEEIVYGLTSLSPQRCSAQQLLEWTRGYWGIENGLHYRRDKTLREDATRISNDNQAQVIAALNNFIVALAKNPGLSNLASARRRFDAQLNLSLAAFA